MNGVLKKVPPISAVRNRILLILSTLNDVKITF